MITKLRNEIKEAIKHKKDSEEMNLRCTTLKSILAKAQAEAKDSKSEEITDSMVYNAAKKEIKQLNDTLKFCENREDKKKETEYSLSVAEEFLPTMVTEEEIREFVISYGEGTLGEIMKALKAKYGDSLDGKLASKVAKAIL